MSRVYEIRGVAAPSPERTGGKPKMPRRRERADVSRPEPKRRTAPSVLQIQTTPTDGEVR